jgi:deoxyribose-phosphate aldolase
MKSITQWIDHTLLKPEMAKKDIELLCAQAKQYGFFAVCVNPAFVRLSKTQLSGTPIKVATVIGFPLGANLAATKAYETELALADGADEFDMVMNIGAARAGDWSLVEEDIRAVVRAAGGRTVKVILETCLLSNEEKVRACLATKAAGAHFVKTSTGFSTGGATEADVRLMRETVGPDFGVKASGGMKTLGDLEKMIKAGANRLGTSSAVSILFSGTTKDGY